MRANIVKIEINATGNSPNIIESFNVIDKDGIKYVFSHKEKFKNRFLYDDISSWLISSIELPGINNTINFNYIDYYSSIVVADPVSRIISDKGPEGSKFYNYLDNLHPYSPLNQLYKKRSQQRDRKLLKSINYGSESIRFSYRKVISTVDGRRVLLDSIKFEQTPMEISFKLSLYPSMNTDYPEEGLHKLDEITFCSFLNSEKKEKYSFSYSDIFAYAPS